MRPDQKSQLLLGATRSKAKMLEYSVHEEHHIKITQDPAKLFAISIVLLGYLAAAINRGEPDPDSIAEMKTNLLFSARFFDSYLQSKRSAQDSSRWLLKKHDGYDRTLIVVC